MGDFRKFIANTVRECFSENNGRLLLEFKNYGYFKDKTTIPDYDAILFNKRDELPKKYIGWVAEIKFMTLKEYITECAKLHGDTYDEQFKHIIDTNVNKIQNNMGNGIKYNIPYLNYIDKTQEGRHRVVAANNLGQKEIPILILNKEQLEPITGNLPNMIGKWNDLVKGGNNYFCLFTNEYELLSCIVGDYDYYYLDNIMSMKKYPTLYGESVGDYISIMIKQNNNSPLSYLDSNISFKTIDNKTKEKYWGIVSKIMENNYNLIFDAISIVDGKYYLKVLNNIGDDFNQYDSCKEMLMSNVKRGYYIEEYNLLSVD